jgi:hypothetical protein
MGDRNFEAVHAAVAVLLATLLWELAKLTCTQVFVIFFSCACEPVLRLRRWPSEEPSSPSRPSDKSSQRHTVYSSQFQHRFIVALMGALCVTIASQSQFAAHARQQRLIDKLEAQEKALGVFLSAILFIPTSHQARW